MKAKSVKLLEDNRGKYLHDHRLKKKQIHLSTLKLRTQFIKYIIKRMKRQAIEWEKVFKTLISNQSLIFRGNFY